MIKLKSLMFEDAKHPLVVYHGTSAKFNKFSLQKSTYGTIWFTSDKEKIISGNAGAAGKGYIITAEVTINNPVGWNGYDKLVIDQYRGMGYDGAVLPASHGHFDCFVLSPNQIKILKIEKI